MSSPSPSRAIDPAASIPRRSRLAVALGAAFTLMCVAVVGLDMPSVFAEGGLFDDLFGDGGYGRRYVVEPLHYGSRRAPQARHGRRHVRHPFAQRAAMRRPGARDHRPLFGNLRRRTPLSAAQVARAIQPARPASAGAAGRFVAYADPAAQALPQGLARRTVCVRSCDGYFFPVANLTSPSQIRPHQATCAKLCPGAETALYILPAGSDNMDEARAARGGSLYSQLKARIDPADDKTKTCSCQTTAADGGATPAYMKDFTLRPGDTVVTPQGMRVVRSGSHYPFRATDFLSLAETRDVPHATRGALAAIERAMKTPRGRAKVEAAGGDEHRRGRRRDGELRSEAAPDAGANPAARSN